MAQNQPNRRNTYQERRQPQYGNKPTQPKEESQTETEPPITGTWSSPDLENPELQETGETESETEDAQPVDSRPLPLFVRAVTHVGPYPKGSVLPVSAFEHLQSLLDLGALVYDYSATAEHILGNPEHLASVTGIGQVVMQTIPVAPWASAAAHNLLGATYVSLAAVNRQWSPAPPASESVTHTAVQSNTSAVEHVQENDF